MTIRTFIALEIPDESLKEIIEIRDSNIPDSNKIRWETLDKLHLTLKFLGDTKEELVEQISKKIDEIILKHNALKLYFNQFGIFKRDKQPKILWAGIKENQKLLDLVKEIEDICSGFGFPKEKRNFKSHITILRIRGHENLEQLYNLTNVKFNPINFSSGVITFIKSELKPSGSVYTALKKFYLTKE